MKRAKNIGIFLLCIVFSPTRFLKRKSEIPKNIFILPVGKLGDVICTTPVFRAVRKHLPQTRIFIGQPESSYTELLKGVNLFDSSISVSRGFWKLIQDIKKNNVDYAALTGPDFYVLAALYLAGVQRIVAPRVIYGKCPTQTRLYRLLLNFVTTVHYEVGKYAPLERLRILEPLNIFETDTKKTLAYSDMAREAIRNFYAAQRVVLGSDLVVGISPSAGNKIKNWGGEKFAEVASYLIEKYNAKVVIVGSKRDKPEVDEMLTHLDTKVSVINAYDMFSIDELKALIADMSLFVSVDTGPIYIAEAFNVPTVDIIGPIDEREQPPIGEFNRVVVPPRRIKPELSVMNAREYDVRKAMGLTGQISALMVCTEIDSLICRIHERMR